MLAMRFTSAFFRSEELSDRLGRTARRYRGMIEEATEGIFLFELDGWVVTVNRALAQMLGYSSAADMQARVTDARRQIFASEADWIQFAQALGSGVNPSQTRDLRSRLQHVDGSEVYVAVNGQAVSDLDTGQIRYQGMVQDVGEQRKLEQLRVERDAAEAASRSKSQFLANMSHEIRTPMNAILGMADLLAEGPGQREQRKYITILQGAGETLLALINDILDLAKVEAGRIELEIVSFDLIELVESTVEIMANEAHKKGLEISHRIDPEVVRYVAGDPTRVRQVLVNLLGNAIKFTSEGGVSVEAVPAPASEAGPGCIFRVRDTGIGIPPEKQERIFDAFSQADNSTTREFGGTGLGLTISKRLAELMHGKIELESVPGEGSVFSLHARFAAGTLDDATTGESKVNLEGIRILVVDDVALNRITFRETLQACGAQVTVVSSGASALAELRRQAALVLDGRQQFDLVLLDYHMPGLDGMETAAQIQADAELRDIRIIAITSDHLPETGQRFKALGVAAHLFKPVKRANLLQIVAEVLDAPTRPEPKVPPQTGINAGQRDAAATDRRLRVLVAEDNEDNQVLIQAYLKDAPIELTLAHNGAEAVDKFEQGGYELIFMDMQMPVLDGYEATRRIRGLEAESWREQPPENRQGVQILDAGCDAHLAKPVKKARLLEAIQRYARPLDEANSDP